MKIILLTQGHVVLVDDEDYEKVRNISWRLLRNKKVLYAKGWIKVNDVFESILMHRFILNLSKGDGNQTDHINRDGLDNQRKNLRVCNNTQNSQNRGKRKNALSQFKGVGKQGNKWQAQIMLNGKNYYLGLFVDQEAAARAYDNKARELFGEFARLNFMEV